MRDRGVVASNFRRLGKADPLASVDLTVLAWCITFCGCTWHRRDGREWLDPAGKRQFANLIKFTDDRVKDRFQAAALAAVHRVSKGG